MNYEAELHRSVEYLNSEAALKSFAADAYWPKWDSPWWHMLLLHEMGETQKIPATMIEAHVSALNRIPLKIFPIHPGDIPAGIDPYRGTPCHCQLGNVYQVLAERGVDVDVELPWIRPWFLRYQMADGGLNCDNDAYLTKDEVPSSMVGTIAVFEAVLLYTKRVWTSEEKKFLDLGAKLLIARKLMNGSETKHNASERQSAETWTKLCFPRYYLYDVLRGLSALLLWGQKTGQVVPPDAIQPVVEHLDRHFPDGLIRNGRLSFAGAGTISQGPDGGWLRRQPATYFALLEKVSALGEVSPFLSRRWREAKTMISRQQEFEESRL